jgi:uncharacterized membrane protein
VTAGTAGEAPDVLVAAMRRLEGDPRLDGLVRRLAPLADATVRSRRVADGLRGVWLGHALHPLLTDFPLGFWMSASLLDLVGGRQAEGPAQRLVAAGLVAAMPTWAAGLAEWRATEGGSRRVGSVHAAVNTTAVALYGCSYAARRRGRHGAAVALGVTGGIVATVGGYFGGHLSLVRKVGTAPAGYGPDTASTAA